MGSTMALFQNILTLNPSVGYTLWDSHSEVTERLAVGSVMPHGGPDGVTRMERIQVRAYPLGVPFEILTLPFHTERFSTRQKYLGC